MNLAVEPIVGLDKVAPKRYLRHPRVVNVRELSEDCFLITDMEDRNEYVVSKAVLDRDYEEI